MTEEEEELVPYFNDVNEAVTAELTKRFAEEYFASIPAMAGEVKQRDEFRAGLKKKSAASEIMSYTLKQEESGMWSARAVDYPRAKERKELWATIADIARKNPDQFESEEDVFRVFTEAYFGGKFLKVAKLIEKTYGKGSFRNLGKKTKAKKFAKNS